MIVVAVLFFVCLVAFFMDVYAAASEGIRFPGWVSAVGFAGMCLLGATLAIGQLA